LEKNSETKELSKKIQKAITNRVGKFKDLNNKNSYNFVNPMSTSGEKML